MNFKSSNYLSNQIETNNREILLRQQIFNENQELILYIILSVHLGDPHIIHILH